MEENFKITTEDIRMAQLHLLKESYALNWVLIEMTLPGYCQATGKTKDEANAFLESVYKQKLEVVDNYIKAEFGQLDISSLLKPKEDQSP